MQNSHCMQEVLLKIRYFERGLSKTLSRGLSRSPLFFLPNPVSFNIQSYQKQKGPGTSDQSLLRSWNKFRKIPLLVTYYLTKFDEVVELFQKLHLQVHDIINYFTSIHPFVSGKYGKEGKKLQKFEYLENEKSFVDEIKNTFHSFRRAIIWWKN